MPQLHFDALWDYQHPDQTEAAFRQLLPQAEHNHDRSYHLQLLTQIARTQGLQRQFAEAHKTLDKVKELLSRELVVPTIRYLSGARVSLQLFGSAERGADLVSTSLGTRPKTRRRGIFCG